MGARLEHAVRSALDHAAELAIRRKHERIDLEHLVIALLGDGFVRQALKRMAVSHDELEARLDACLDARPSAAGYRDGSVPSQSSRLTGTLERARPAGVLGFVRSIGLGELFPAVVADPGVAQLLFEARLGALTMSSILEHAKLVAASRSHRTARLEHALLAICDSEWFGSALEHAGSATRFADALEAVLRPDRSGEPAAKVSVSPDLDAFARASVAAARASNPGSEGVQFVARVLRSPLSEPLFEFAETSRYELLRAVAHREVPSELVSSIHEGACEVVFHNDDLTTMDFVFETLQRVFDLENTEAMQRMLQVHQAGESVIGVFPVEDARRRVEVAMARARDALMPLRISLRPSALR